MNTLPIGHGFETPVTVYAIVPEGQAIDQAIDTDRKSVV